MDESTDKITDEDLQRAVETRNKSVWMGIEKESAPGTAGFSPIIVKLWEPQLQRSLAYGWKPEPWTPEMRKRWQKQQRKELGWWKYYVRRNWWKLADKWPLMWKKNCREDW